MRTHTLILLAATFSVGACKRGDNAAAPATTGAAPAEGQGEGRGPGLIAEHGGSIASRAGFTAEVVTQADGKLLAYVRGPQGPVQSANVMVTVRNADGTSKPVAVAWDSHSNAYVGYVWGVQPGAKRIDVALAPQAGAPAQSVTADVNVAAVATPPAARFGGTVEIIGQYAVEIVPARTGDVAFFVMDLQGNPVPSADVELPRLSVNVAAAPVAAAAGAPAMAVAAAVPAAPPVVLTAERVGDHFVAHHAVFAAASTPAVSFGVDLTVRGETYANAVVPPAPVIAVLPPALAVAAPAATANVVVPAVAARAASANVVVPAVAAGARINVGAPSVRVNVGVPTPPAVVMVPPAIGLRVGAAAPAMAAGARVNIMGSAVAARPAVAVPAVAAGARVNVVGAAVAPRPAVAVAAPAMAARGGGAVVAGGGATAHGTAHVGASVALPAPPPPPSVNVQGGFRIGGGVSIH